MLSSSFSLCPFSVIVLLSSLLLASAVPVGQAPRLGAVAGMPLIHEVQLMRSDKDGNAIRYEPVGVNEIWALKVGDAEFRAVEEPKGSGTWKGLPVSIPSRTNAGAITVGHATFPSSEVWQLVQNHLQGMTASSNLEYIHHVFSYLQVGDYLEGDLLIWLQPDTGNGFVGLYHQMQALGGSAGGRPLK